MKRSLLYWAKCALKMFGITLTAVIIISALNFLLISDSNRGMSYMISMVQIYCLFIGSIVVLGSQVSYSLYNLPIIISFGALRKQSFIEIQFMNIILLIENYVLFVVASIICNGRIESINMPMYIIVLTVMIFLMGIGEHIVAITMRFQKIGTIIMVIFFMIIGGIGGFFFSMTGMKDRGPILQRAVLDNRIIIWSAAITIMVYALGAFLMYRAIKKYEVKL